jgi:ferredoxin--NADP+ reductase
MRGSDPYNREVRLTPVVLHEQFSPFVHHFEIEAPLIAKKTQPGQFVIIRPDELGERVPMSVAGIHADRGTLELVVQIVGKTSASICERRVGDTFTDVVGPLGVPTHIPDGLSHAVVVGGGIGIAPIRPIAEALKERGVRITAILGARNKDLLFFEDVFGEIADDVIVTTDDGSKGVKGFVTTALEELIEKDRPDWVMAVGPMIMMKFVSLLTKKHGIPTMVSLNPIMIDGTGMCGGCRVVIDGKTQYACVDGPDFDGHLVDYDALMKRQRAYVEQEAKAVRLYEEEHDCKLGLDQ